MRLNLRRSNDMEQIKVGDIVRVSKDAPMMYNPKEMDGIVMEIDGEDAFIKSECTGIPPYPPFWVLAIPAKYLIKVNAEPKEPTIKVGDVVENLESHNKGIVGNIGGNFVLVDILGSDNRGYWSFDAIKPVQPKEPTEKPNFGKITIPVEADLTDSFWDAYTADLAKEIAVKIASPLSYETKVVAEYAVSIAKSVVENLKRESNERE